MYIANKCIKCHCGAILDLASKFAFVLQATSLALTAPPSEDATLGENHDTVEEKKLLTLDNLL